MGSSWSLGVDIGYTNIRAAAVIGGVPKGVIRRRTDVAGGPRGVLEQVTGAVKELMDLESSKPVGVGIGIAGQCDIELGVVRCGPNLWWHDEPFQEMVSEATGLRVVLRNDVVMATVGEWLYGAGRGADDLVCLFVGTGIGGGAVVNGTLLEGHSGCGGHFGHVSVQMDGPACTCGRPGCVEAYAGGWGVARQAEEALAKDPLASPVLHALTGGRMDAIDCRMVAEAAHQGDLLALRIRDGMAAALSSGLASVVNSFNPERIVLGGTVLNGFPHLYSMTVEGLRKQALRSALVGLEVSPAELGDLAGVVGAGSMALEKLR